MSDSLSYDLSDGLSDDLSDGQYDVLSEFLSDGLFYGLAIDDYVMNSHMVCLSVLLKLTKLKHVLYFVFQFVCVVFLFVCVVF